MNIVRQKNSVVRGSPHLTQEEIQEKLSALETADGQSRVDLMTELAWRPAWAIRSRRGVFPLLWAWLLRVWLLRVWFRICQRSS